jgi:hypothetical protein
VQLLQGVLAVADHQGPDARHPDLEGLAGAVQQFLSGRIGLRGQVEVIEGGEQGSDGTSDDGRSAPGADRLIRFQR